MMDDRIHLLIATTFSMLLTFVFDCVLTQTRASNSLLQQFCIDTIHDWCLTISCWFDVRHSMDICDSLLIGADLTKVRLLLIIIYLFLALRLCFGVQLFDRLKPIILTILVSWLITRYFDNKNIYYKMDVLSIYFIVWQFIYLLSKWEDLELKCPLLIIQQASCCASSSIMAFLFHDIMFVYFPFQFKIIYLWLYSLYDIFICLHPYGRLWMKLVMNWSQNSSPPGLYYTCDIDDPYDEKTNFNDNDFENVTIAEEHLNMDELHYKSGLSLGLGDFFVFNQMVLFILLPAWSIITKILVVCSCIIAIQFGQFGTAYMIARLWKLRSGPGLPLPVIAFSMYAFILNVIMNYTNNNC